MKRLAIALALLSLPPAVAAKDDFKDLPGVHDPAKAKEKELDIVCTSALVPRRSASGWNGLYYRAYSCRYGRSSLGSNRPPNMIEYRKFKEHYD